MEYKLQPHAEGGYILQQLVNVSPYSPHVWMAVTHTRIQTLEQAEKIIKNIERPAIYLGDKA